MKHPSERRRELFTYFEECVKKHFSFLSNMSYSIDKNSMGWKITYSTEKVEVSIYYERISFEIYLTVLLKRLGVHCAIDEIIQHDLKRKFLFATEYKMIENAVMELQTLVIRYGTSFINGDISVFEKVLEERKKNSKNYDLELIEKRAVKAWENKNYKEVIALYQSIKDNLTPIQEKRLHLSLKKIKE